jgi:hypothetical protein
MATNLTFRLAGLGSAVLLGALATVHTVQAVDSASGQRSVNQQRVLVSVVDKQGVPVAALTPADLTITEMARPASMSGAGDRHADCPVGGQQHRLPGWSRPASPSRRSRRPWAKS